MLSEFPVIVWGSFAMISGGSSSESFGANAECLHWMKSLQMPTLFEEHASSVDSSLVF